MKQKHLSQLLVVLAMILSVVLIGSASATLTDGQLIRGDVNGDNAVNMKDVLLLRKYLADMDVEFADHICSVAPSESTEPSASETQPSYTQPSVTQPSYTQPSYTTPSETQPSVTQPSQSQPSQSQTQPSQTQPSVTPEGSIKVQMNLTEHQTKYDTDVQLRTDTFFVEKGQPVTLLLTYDDVYHATTAVKDGTAAT